MATGLKGLGHGLGVFFKFIYIRLEALLKAVKRFFDKENTILTLGLCLVFKGIYMQVPWLAYVVTGSVLLFMVLYPAARK